MFAKGFIYRGPGRRSLIGLLIAGVHICVVALFVLGMHVPRGNPELSPITVEFVEKQPSKLDPPTPSNPKLVSIAPLALESPDVPLPAATQALSEITTEMPAPPAPTSITSTNNGSHTALATLSDVAYIEPPAPRYPPQSKHAREEGLVILRVLIDESGHASSVNVYRSSGHPRLDEAARKAVQCAVFKPYRDSGIARAVVAIIPIEFSLHSTGDRGRRNG